MKVRSEAADHHGLSGRCTWLPMVVETAAKKRPMQADIAVISIGRSTEHPFGGVHAHGTDPIIGRRCHTRAASSGSPTRQSTIPSWDDIAQESWATLVGIGTLGVSHTFSLTVRPLRRESRAPRVYADILARTNLFSSGQRWGWGWGWPCGACRDTQASVGVPVSRTTVSDRTTLRNSDIVRLRIDLRQTCRNAAPAYGQCRTNIF
jgi:hypothetical protein